MKQLKSILSRVRWNVVMGIIATILLVALIAVVLVTIKPLDSGYKGEDDIRIKSWAEPSTVKLNDESRIWIDIRNTGSNTRVVHVTLESHDPSLKFIDTNNQTIKKDIAIGPKESRKPGFPVEINAELSGDYGIRILVSYTYDRIEDEVILNVRRG